MTKRLSPSVRLTLTYLLVSISWILLSDRLTHLLAGQNHELLTKIQSIKGLLFVGAYAVLLYLTSQRLYRRLGQTLNKSSELLNKYQALAEVTKECVIDYDLQQQCAEINLQMQKCMEVNTEQVSDFWKKFLARIHENDREAFTTALQQAMAAGVPSFQAECRFRCGGKVFTEFLISGYLIRENPGGEARRFIFLMRDISEINGLRNAHYEQELQYRQSLGRIIIKAQEEERNRWAEELHDNVCQKLTVAKLYLDSLEQQEPSEVNRGAKALINNVLQEIRELSAHLKPPEFAAVTLSEAIEELFISIRRIRTFHLELDHQELQENLLTNEQKLMTYRVIQEQLNNITKYARPANVRVSLATRNQKMQIEVQDDGVGFDPDRVKGGIGLRNIQSRLQMFRGNMHVQSAPGAGCTLRAEFSLTP